MHVDLESLDHCAREVAQHGDDLGTAAGRWRAALADPCAPSVRAVRDAYIKDFAVYAEVLRSWAGAACTAVSTYRITDAENAGTP